MSLSRITPTRIALFDTFKERKRVAKSGKVSSRMTIEFETTELLHELDEMVLGQLPADAVREIVSGQIHGISARVSDATIERRISAYNNPGSRWYKRRYAGGRTGETPPDPNSNQWGVDSGRLANHLTVRDNPTDGTYTINVVANRLRRDTFGPGFDDFLSKLSSLVEAIKNPRSIANDPRFNAAVNESVKLMITAAKSRREAERVARLKRLRLERRKTLRALVSTGRGFGTGL